MVHSSLESFSSLEKALIFLHDSDTAFFQRLGLDEFRQVRRQPLDLTVCRWRSELPELLPHCQW